MFPLSYEINFYVSFRKVYSFKLLIVNFIAFAAVAKYFLKNFSGLQTYVCTCPLN
jgi:hypothetical protein